VHGGEFTVLGLEKILLKYFHTGRSDWGLRPVLLLQTLVLRTCEVIGAG